MQLAVLSTVDTYMNSLHWINHLVALTAMQRKFPGLEQKKGHKTPTDLSLLVECSFRNPKYSIQGITYSFLFTTLYHHLA